ncbi:MAG: glycosyltransferase family 1 protein [Candidatus Njordarchaeales archaeon]
MRIAVFSRWNATCGVSLHAELIVREWASQGHKVVVFAPVIEEEPIDWHHKKIDVEDEAWVYRVYMETKENDSGNIKIPPEIDLRSFDAILVESYPFIPYKDIYDILREVRGSVKTFIVVHESSREEASRLSKIVDVVDGIIVFDNRFITEVLGAYYSRIRRKVHIIPYPCYDRLEDVKKIKKRIFGDPEIVFISYGRQPKEEYFDYIEAVKKIREVYGYEAVYKIIRSDSLIEEANFAWVEQKIERPSIEKVLNYLISADIHLLPKGKVPRTVVSSTIAQSLTALVPTVVPNTRHFELIPEDEYGVGPVVKYRNLLDLEYKLLKLIEDEEFRKKVIASAEKYVQERSHKRIAMDFIKLFEQ